MARPATDGRAREAHGRAGAEDAGDVGPGTVLSTGTLIGRLEHERRRDTVPPQEW